MFGSNFGQNYSEKPKGQLDNTAGWQPTTFSAGQILGDYVFLNSKVITPEETPTGEEGFGVKVFSSTGDLIASINPFVNGVTDFSFVREKLGGLKSFTFTVPPNTIPFYNEADVRFYFNNRLIESGFLNGIPEKDDDGNMIYNGVGYANLFIDEEINIETSEENVGDLIVQIFRTLNNKYNVNYNPAKVDACPAALQTLNITDVYKNILSFLVRVASGDDGNVYIWGVDKNRDLYFKKTETIENVYYDDIHFFQSTVETDYQSIVNSITIRKKYDDVDEVIGNYFDPDSIDKYGEKFQEIVIPYAVDDTTAINAGIEYLNKYKNPFSKIEVGSFIESDQVNFGRHVVNMRLKQPKMKTVIEGETTTGWYGPLNISTSNERVFTGRSSIYVSLPGNTGTKSFDLNIPFPEKMRMYFYQTNSSDSLTIQFIDNVSGDIQSETLQGSIINSWTEKVIDFSIRNLSIVRIISSGGSGIFYLDRFDHIYSRYDFYNVELERVTTNFQDGALTSMLEFGEKEDNLIDELTNLKEDSRKISKFVVGGII